MAGNSKQECPRKWELSAIRIPRATCPQVCRTAGFPAASSKKEAGKAGPKMQTTAEDKVKIRKQLKAKRNQLLEEYSKNPMNTRLAVEIRLIDDQIAEITEHLVERRKSGLD